MCHRLESRVPQPSKCGRRPGPTSVVRYHCWRGPEKGWDSHGNIFLCASMGSWMAGCLLCELQGWGWLQTTAAILDSRGGQCPPPLRVLCPRGCHHGGPCNQSLPIAPTSLGMHTPSHCHWQGPQAQIPPPLGSPPLARTLQPGTAYHFCLPVGHHHCQSPGNQPPFAGTAHYSHLPGTMGRLCTCIPLIKRLMACTH